MESSKAFLRTLTKNELIQLTDRVLSRMNEAQTDRAKLVSTKILANIKAELESRS